MNAPAPKQELSFDLGEARKFLKLLGRLTASFTFQTFDDCVLLDGKKRGDKSLAGIFHGTLKQHAETLMDYNRRGAGVFVTMNATNGRGRKKTDITHARVIWHEDDSGLDRIFPLHPNIINESSPGKKHRCWFVDELKHDEHAALMAIMVDLHGSDPNAADLARVLRLPGFYHCKNPERPHLVRSVGGTAWLPGLDVEEYARDKVLAAFGFVRQERPEKVAVERAPGAFDRAKLLQAVMFIPADNRAIWLKVGMALHYETNGGLEGREIWSFWSENAPGKFDRDDLERVWASFNGEGGELVTGGTLYRMAKAHGWPGDIGAKTRHFEEIGPTPPGKAPAAASTPPRLTRRMSEVEEKPVNWFWYPYIPAGQGSLLAGLGAVGKGLIASSLAAAVTTGSPLPGSSERAEPGDVFWWEAEDSAEHTLKARFRAAGADMQRIHEIRPKNFALLNLKDYIRRENIKLIIASPLVAFLKGLDDLNSELKMRAALDIIQDAIDGTDCAFFGLAHLNKKEDLGTIGRVLGSVALVNFMRSVLFAAKENQESGQGRLVHVKHNLSRKGRDLLYTPVSSNDRAQEVKVVWSVPEGNVEADTMFDRKKKRQTAGAWLVEYLRFQGGEVFKSKVIADGEAAGHSESAIEKARQDNTHIKSRQDGFQGPAMWWLETSG